MADSKDLSLLAFQATSLDDITAKVASARAAYRSNKTKDIQFRIVQLRKLYWGLVDNAPLIEAALMKDLRKSKHEATVTEIDWCTNSILEMLKNIEEWAQDEPVVGVPLQMRAMKHRVRREPFGVVLVIGSFNFPFQLTLTPVIGAIAAGNTVIMKPSELAPYSAMALTKVIQESLDPDCYSVVNGAIPETTRLLDGKFDKIAFTGGKTVGKIIAKKAAETLTPVLLELGGLNPAFVTKNANLKLAARRLLFGKTHNAGQVCLSANYILVERSALSQFIGELSSQYRVMMPKGAKNSPDYGRVVNKAHFRRLKKMLDETKGKIILGGSMDEDDLFIEPTAVLVDSVEDSMMVQESFGPIFSVMAFDSLDQAIQIANEVDSTPLGLYSFGSDAENQKVLDNVTSGGATFNDSFAHCQIPQSPIGGVGQSGTGSYHGWYSFQAFSHARNIAQTPGWADSLLRVRYMPYSTKALKQFQAMGNGKADFDRSGRQVRGLWYVLGLVLGLGGKSAQGVALRWAVVLATAASVALKNDYLGQLRNSL